jgi:hypothetical protein
MFTDEISCHHGKQDNSAILHVNNPELDAVSEIVGNIRACHELVVRKKGKPCGQEHYEKADRQDEHSEAAGTSKSLTSNCEQGSYAYPENPRTGHELKCFFGPTEVPTGGDLTRFDNHLRVADMFAA